MTKIDSRRWLRLLHLWLGLGFCVPFVMLGLTGTLLTFEHAIEGLTQTATAATSPSGPAQPVAAIVAAARQAAPQGQVPTLYSPPAGPGKPAIVRFQPSARGGGGGPGFGAQLAVDPVTLAVSEGAGVSDFWRTVHRLHGNLLINNGRDGRSIIGWFGVGMLAMSLSGLYIWWPRPGRWKAAMRVSSNARGFRLHRELHGAAGFWSLIVFVIVSFSGVDLAFPETASGLVATVLPGADTKPAPIPQVSRIAGAQPADADQAIALALASMPNATLRSVGLPARPDQPYRVGLAHDGAGDGAPMVTIFVDPWAARVVEVRDPSAYATGLRLMTWQHAIHSGAGLGAVWRILVGLSGLLPALFTVTGIAMWLLKRKARRRSVALAIPTAEAAE